jgi:hypothetical protein
VAGREVDQLDYVSAGEAMDLGAADGSSERALNHHQRPLAQRLGNPCEERVSVGRGEVFELGLADVRIDPVLGLADDDFHRVRVSLDRVEPVLDAPGAGCSYVAATLRRMAVPGGRRSSAAAWGS